MKKKVFLLIDYNLSRVNDVKKIKNYLQNQYKTELVLVKNNPKEIDSQISDYVINSNPLDSNFVDHVVSIIENMTEINVIAGLVFSDNAVFSGAKLLKKLNLYSDDVDLAVNALCKYHYREEENKIKKLLEAQGFFIPNVKKISSSNDLLSFFKENSNGILLKPMKEGNNRGVILLKDINLDQLDRNLEEVSQYIKDGLMAEELIPFENEYSYDGIGNFNFITEKISSKGSRYPVEYGQILPAQLSINIENLIKTAGALSNLIVGQKKGAFHNEILVDKKHHKVAVVEANRRPAGMKIWNLAKYVFNVDLYEYWVDSVMKQDNKLPILNAAGSAMSIMLPSYKTMYFVNINILATCIAELKSNFKSEYPENTNSILWGEYEILVKQNDLIHFPPRSGEDFLLLMVIYSPCGAEFLKKYFNILQEMWKKILETNIEANLKKASYI